MAPPVEVQGSSAASALSLACEGKNRWLVAYATRDGQMALRRFDGAHAVISDSNLASEWSLNTRVVSRPAMVVLKNRIVLAWWRLGKNGAALITVRGRIDANRIDFKPLRALDFPDFVQRDIVSDPDLTHGFMGNFLLVFVRETPPEDLTNEVAPADPSFPPWNAVVLASPDNKK